MPRKILASQRAKFWQLIKADFTIAEAARRAGFSESYGKTLMRNGASTVVSGKTPARISSEIEAEIATRPKRRHELSDLARDCLDDFGRFRAVYLGSVSLPWQEEGAHRVADNLDSDDDRYGVINAPQGAGKTRLFTHDIPAWLTARDRSMRGCLGSGTMPISERMTGTLRTTLARKSPVTAAERWKRRGMALDALYTISDPDHGYGRFKPIMPGVMWTRPEFSVEQLWTEADNLEDAEYIGATQDKEATWAAFSYEAQVMSMRFDFMQWDDLHTWRQLRNPDLMSDLFTWWDTEAESRLDPGGLCLVTMQRLGANDISRYLLDKIDPAFEIDTDRPDEAPRQYFHVTFKAHYDDRCQGQHDSDAPSYPQGCMLDPRRIPQQKINAKKVAGTYEVVYQQEDTDPASVLVQKDWVEGCWDDQRTIGQLPPIPTASDVIRYMTVDPSPTMWWGIIDWIYVVPPGVDKNAGYRYVMDLARVRMGANDFLDRAADGTFVGLAEDWVQRAKAQGIPVEWLVMERNAAQRWAFQYAFFGDWWRSRGVQVREHETTRNKSDPDYGVWATLPSVWQYNRVRLPGRDRSSRLAIAPLIQEVTTYPDGATDDLVMSQWFGEYHLPNLISTRRTVSQFYRDQPSWMGGARTPSYVERKVTELALR